MEWLEDVMKVLAPIQTVAHASGSSAGVDEAFFAPANAAFSRLFIASVSAGARQKCVYSPSQMTELAVQFSMRTGAG